jgi:hypothetical protein
MGFTNLKVLYLQQSLKQDWIDRGYPHTSETPTPAR